MASVNCQFITGNAGTGKTYSQRERIKDDPSFAILAATTGIAAINLGTVTINSILRYFDTESLKDAFVSGKLRQQIHRLVSGPRKVNGIIIDEASMMEASQLDTIYDAFNLVANYQDVPGDLNLILTGDFAQLPPVQGKFAFQADCWPEFDKNTDRLTKVWRQDNSKFLQALDAFRIGDGVNGVSLLKECGVKFSSGLTKFDGTTIVPKNQMVDDFNLLRFRELDSQVFTIPNRKEGQQLSEWKSIPDTLSLKDGALVMILANNNEFGYANGDTGLVESYNAEGQEVYIRLFRNNEVVPVTPVQRLNKDYVDELQPDGSTKKSSTRHVVGAVEFMPLRLAYATTCHKSQGLTLERAQLDFRDRFFGNPGMMYVALSRVRTPEGLRLVGTEDLMIKRTVINPLVKRFL